MDTPPESQRCGHCKVVKPLSEFNRNRNYVTGRATQCRDCASEASRRSAAKREARLPGIWQTERTPPTEEQKMEEAAAARERYRQKRADPEWAARQRERGLRALHARKARDPEAFYAKQRANSNRYTARKRAAEQAEHTANEAAQFPDGQA